MKVKVKGYLTFREVVGDLQLQFDDGGTITVHDILSELLLRSGDEFADMVFEPKTKQLSQWVAILINGRHYSHLPDRLETALSDQDEVAIFPPIAGG